MKANTQKIESQLFGIILYAVDGTIDYIYSIVNPIKNDVTPESDNIRKSLKNAKNIHSALIIIGKGIKKLHRKLRLIEQSDIRNNQIRNELKQWNKFRRSIKSQPHNSALSMV